MVSTLGSLSQLTRNLTEYVTNIVVEFTKVGGDGLGPSEVGGTSRSSIFAFNTCIFFHVIHYGSSTPLDLRGYMHILFSDIDHEAYRPYASLSDRGKHIDSPSR